jgi:hypothetical protein
VSLDRVRPIERRRREPLRRPVVIPATSVGMAVSESVDALVLDLLEWMGPSPRPYGEVIEAWRTSCPRLPVWEDANDSGFIARRREPGRGMLVSVSVAGAEHLRRQRARLSA